MLVAEARRDKTDLFNEALKDSKHEPTAEAVTPRKATAKKTSAEESKTLSDAEATPLADTAAVEEAVSEAEAPVAQSGTLGDEAAAGRQVAESGAAPPEAPSRPTAAPTGRELTMLVDALDHLVRGIVDNPDDVSVRSREPRGVVVTATARRASAAVRPSRSGSTRRTWVASSAGPAGRPPRSARCSRL